MCIPNNILNNASEYLFLFIACKITLKLLSVIQFFLAIDQCELHDCVAVQEAIL